MSLYQSKFFFTSKQDGNLAFHVGDDPQKVTHNHQLLSKKHSYNLETLVHMKQIHSDIVHIIDKYNNFKNPPTCDALITDKPNIPLMVMVADCTPVLFYDQHSSVIAGAHVGRAGAFKNIVKNVVDSFVDQFNSDPKNIKIEIGPSICKECYEVGAEIYKEASDLGLGFAIEKKENKFYLDVNKIILKQLNSSGILEKNINILKECSSCDQQNYYSYRRDGQTGRFAGVIVLA